MIDRPVALITGSATGIGRACALRCAREGHAVVVNYTKSQAEAEDTVKQVESAGMPALLLKCDVSQCDDVSDMIESIKNHFGRLDLLVNNAGCTSFVEHADLDAMTEEKWDRILAVNLKGTFFVTRAAAPMLKVAPNAAVINVSSVAGIAGLGSSIAYCASKGAVNTMTKSLARVLAPEIRVNAVCPGPVDTRWLREWKTGEEIRELTAFYPMQRASTPDDIADAVWSLAAGSSMVTGQLLVIDGGRTM